MGRQKGPAYLQGSIWLLCRRHDVMGLEHPRSQHQTRLHQLAATSRCRYHLQALSHLHPRLSSCWKDSKMTQDADTGLESCAVCPCDDPLSKTFNQSAILCLLRPPAMAVLHEVSIPPHNAGPFILATCCYPSQNSGACIAIQLSCWVFALAANREAACSVFPPHSVTFSCTPPSLCDGCCPEVTLDGSATPHE